MKIMFLPERLQTVVTPITPMHTRIRLLTLRPGGAEERRGKHEEKGHELWNMYVTVLIMSFLLKLVMYRSILSFSVIGRSRLIMMLGISCYNFTYTKFLALQVYKSCVFSHKQDSEYNSVQT